MSQRSRLSYYLSRSSHFLLREHLILKVKKTPKIPNEPSLVLSHPPSASGFSMET